MRGIPPHPPHGWQWIVVAWFAISIPLLIFGHVGFATWLRSQGVDVSWFYQNTPGYLMGRYAAWCAQTGRSSTRGVTFLRGITINGILAAIAFAVLMTLRE